MSKKQIFGPNNQSSQIEMYRGLIASGAILAFFGTLLIVTDWYVPLGVSVFGFPISIAGVIMVGLGFLRSEPEPIEPDPGKKFCWYCMEQIPKSAEECPACSLPQREARD